MNQQFYIAVNGQQTGPFSYEELKAKGIQRDTLIWTEGLDSWTKAEYVSLVKDILRVTPPPIPNDGKQQQQAPPPPIPQPKGKYFGYELASKWQRLVADIVGSLILLVPFLILRASLYDNYSDDSSLGDYFILMIIILIILGAIFYSMWSGNLGHKIMGLKVISSNDGKDKNKAISGAYREGLKHILNFLVIPNIWLLWDEDNQNLYDKVAKTYVVKKK